MRYMIVLLYQMESYVSLPYIRPYSLAEVLPDKVLLDCERGLIDVIDLKTQSFLKRDGKTWQPLAHLKAY